jgi:hypothetical protein
MKKLLLFFICLFSLVAASAQRPEPRFDEQPVFGYNMPRWSHSVELQENIITNYDFYSRSHVAYVAMRNFTRNYSVGFAVGGLTEVYGAARGEARLSWRYKWVPFLSADLGFNYSDGLYQASNISLGARYRHLYWGAGFQYNWNLTNHKDDQKCVTFRFGYTF